MQTVTTETNKATNAVAKTQDEFIHAEPLNAQKRIGSTVYELKVYVKSSTGETAEEKILRLIRNDLNLAPSHVNMNMPQTSRLERSSA
jgi:hypothetical protein